MSPRRNRNRSSFVLESLEQRNAPSQFSGLGSALETLHHRGTRTEHAARVRQVASLRQGADDTAGHQRRGRGRDDVAVVAVQTRRGRDDAANHDANDLRRGRGRDDAANHDANDLRRGRGRDDAPGHR